MRVVFLTTNLAPGGAESQVARLASNLRCRWDVSVVSMLPPTAFEKDLAAANVPLHSLGMKPGKLNLPEIQRFAVLMRKLRPHVVHSHMFHANLLARLARVVLPVPVVISTSHSAVESSGEADDSHRRERAYHLTNWLAEATVAICEAGGARLAANKAVSPSRLRTIPNGVETDRFKPDPKLRSRCRQELGLNQEFAWLAVGRLMWKKDYVTMLRAFGKLGRGVLLIAGAGPQEAELRSLAREFEPDVRFLGARTDIPALMNACDGFLLSSVIEGLPVVLLEASSCGVPIVATDVGGVSEIVFDARTGYLAPPSDPSALATAMGWLMNLPEDVRRQMGCHARQYALERFGWQVVTARWEALYAGLLKSASHQNLEL